jgi:hypothetical protein
MAGENQSVQGPPSSDTEDQPFVVRDCALISIATGHRTFSLIQLRDMLASVSADSIYFHFWGGLLEARFEEREFNNDFAAWARHGMHDAILAERLAMLDPTLLPDLEDLRQELLDVIDARLDESEYLPWVRATHGFEFIRSQIVVFDTHRRLQRPEELARVMPELSTSSVFYHFIDARRRQPDCSDDFQAWLRGCGEQYGDVCEALAAVDPYFGNLRELRRELAALFRNLSPGEPP